MLNFNRNKTIKEENPDELKAKEYMNKYIKELQRHFDLSDRKMRAILHKIYKETGPLFFLKRVLKKFSRKFFKKYSSMLKSPYRE